MEETFQDNMEPNESSSYCENREYFQTLEIQRREFLMEILDKCDNGPKRIDPKLLTPEEKQEWLRNFEVRQVLPGNAVRRLHSTEVHGRIPARRNGTESLSQKVDEVLKILPDLHKGLADLKAEITDLKKNQRENPKTSRSRQERIRDALGTVPLLHQKGKATEIPKPRLKENLGRNPKRVPENTPWARTMLQPLHPYGSILNLDIIDFRNTEKLIDEWVAAIKIAATTLELDKENFIKLVELSLEGSVKIGWDNTPEDTKASILAGDSKGAIADRLGRLIKIHFIGDGYFEGSRAEKAREYAQALFSLELRNIYAVDEYIYWFRKYFFQSGVATEVAAPMFFAKICSPWREMLIQSYEVPEGQLDSVARRMSFLKDKLKDWCYQASIQKNMKRLRGESSEPKKRKKQNSDSYTRSSRRTFSRRRHGGPSPKPEHTKLDKEQDQQGLHPKDLDEQMQDPPEEPLQEELSDGPIPEPMKVLKIAIAGLAEQKDIYLPIVRRNVVN
ncbi:UNVERIFIED_CONTAM: hypothetical protein Sindi_2008800 [Sesamum indicum]